MGIDEAFNGEEAVKKFQERIDLCIESNWLIKPYRMIFIDYNMPVLDGPSAVRQIRQICQDLKNSGEQSGPGSSGQLRTSQQLSLYTRNIHLNPFIAIVSGESEQQSIKNSLDCGANSFLQKPTPFK